MSGLTDADYIALGRILERFGHANPDWAPYLFVGHGGWKVLHVTIDGQIDITPDEADVLERAWTRGDE